MKKGLALVALVAAFAGLSWGVVAADSIPKKIITVSPATTKPVIDPGDTTHGTLQVINQGSPAYDVTIYASPYGVQGEDYRPQFTAVPGKTDVTSWITFDKTKATVAKDKTVDIGYTIAVPKNTEPGGYYTVVFAESKSAKSKNGVVVNQRVGEIFYIRVAGKVRESGKVATWSASFLQTQPVKATLRLQNDGGVHYGSDVHIYVKDLFGGTKYALISDKEVLPQTIRHIPFSWDKAPPFGLFKITGNVHLPSGETRLGTKMVLIISPTLRIVFATIVVLLVIGAAAFLIMKTKTPQSTGSPKAKRK